MDGDFVFHSQKTNKAGIMYFNKKLLSKLGNSHHVRLFLKEIYQVLLKTVFFNSSEKYSP